MARTKSVARAVKRESARPIPSSQTHDSFQNFYSRIGQGTDNQASFGTMGLNPITRNRVILDWAYRGSWICRKTVKTIPEDMTREGFDLGSDLPPDATDKLHTAFNIKFNIWTSLREAQQWARLYGGAIAVMLIDGQKLNDPLRLETVGQHQFCGLAVIDRWMLDPSTNDLVTDLRSKDLGKPKYYRVNADSSTCARENIHHSRVLRFEGDDLPYQQRLSEQLWGLSVLEPIWDRILAFDSATSGTAQLVYRAHIRNYKIAGLRKIIAAGGDAMSALLQQVDWMRRFQGNEGMSMMDTEDEYESSQYAFGGLDSVLLQMGQQLSGAIDIPMVRLFGQSPTGLNSTGESDLRNYYDGLKGRQETDLKPPVNRLLPVVARSEGIKIPDNFNYGWKPLWQMPYVEKVSVVAQGTSAIIQAHAEQLISPKTALKELRSMSHYTGFWTNITDEDIDKAEEDPPQMDLPPGPEEMGNFLPGGGEEDPALPPPLSDDDSNVEFLPGSRRRRLSHKLRLSSFKKDSSGALIFGELEKKDKEEHKPLHIHLTMDQDNHGRETEFQGIPIIVEVEKGWPRRMGSSGGAIMEAPYGYIPDTEGLDGDSVDVFVGSDDNSKKVFIIDQCDPDTGKMHQHKCFVGFHDTDEVVNVFKKFYADGRGGERLKRGQELTVDQFKTWLKKYEKRAA